MVHVNGSETIQNVLKAGADSIEHGYYMDDETIRRLADSKTVWVPTVVTVANLLKDPKHRYHTESVKQILALQEENIRKAVKAGCMLAAGSDAGAYMVPHCDGLVDEVECFKHILADDAETDRVLTRGENAIKSMFRRNYG
jgi:imidazolonepropionase-like amidohydrolase